MGRIAAGRRGAWWPHAVRGPLLALVVVPLLLTGFPIGAVTTATAVPTSPDTGVSAAGSSPHILTTATLTIQNQTKGNLSDFWGVGLNPGYNLTNISNETKGTPVNWVVWPAGDFADEYDMVNGTLWTDGVPSQDLNTEVQFVAACRAISCHAIFTVPGEINNPTFGAYEVWYTEQVLGFHPAYWEVGNEPYKWGEYGLPWSQWTTKTSPGPSPLTYANEVHAYVAAMRAVDPTVKFIGLPGTGHGSNPDEPWLNATIEVNGPNLSAVAIHDYPGEGGVPNGTLSQFYQSLTKTKTYMISRIAADERQVKLSEANISCSTCSIQFFVDEFGAGTRGGAWEPYMHTYAEIPYIAAELAMMSESNVTNAELFELRSGYNGSLFNGLGQAFPLDSLYTQILPHYDTLPLAESLTGNQSGLFAAASESPNSNSVTVLAVNTNLTQPIQLAVAGNLFPNAGTFEEWTETNSTAFPNGSVSETTGVETTPSWVIPPLGVVLVSVCRSNASLGAGGLYPLSFCSSGLPPATPWSVTVGSTQLTTTAGTLTFPEPNGSYSYQLGGVPNWTTPNWTGSITVAGGPASVQIPWTVYTYPVTFNQTGLPIGTPWSVNLSGTIYNSTSASLTGFEPNGTFAYLLGVVSGFRPPAARGNVSVNASAAWVDTTWNPVYYNVTFHQSGLVETPHTNWSIDFNGSVGYNGSGDPIHFTAENGTYPFTVAPVNGFTPDARTGSVTVRGYPKYIPLTWAKNASVFSIWINETGLPPGVAWNVTLNGTPAGGTAASNPFYQPNGTYAYTLGGASGWTPGNYSGNVTVAGAPVDVPIHYTRILYNATFSEVGLPPANLSLGWSVDLNGTSETSYTTTLVVSEPNGSFPFTVPGVPGYTPSPKSGTAELQGNGTYHTITFAPSVAPVTFIESGLYQDGETTWTVNVTGLAPIVNYFVRNTLELNLTNGSYEYNASTSLGEVELIPADGNFTENGTPLVIELHFYPLYAVTFVQTGLLAGTSWSVTLNGTLATSTASTITFLEPNGTYAFSAPNVGNLAAVPDSGRVQVSGASENLSIGFGVPTYPVWFNETGLPAGTNWSVSVDGIFESSTTPTISFREPNGTLSYVVEPIAGWFPSPPDGSFPVSGAEQSVLIHWMPFTYAVTFNGSGLPSGTPWSVTLPSGTHASNGRTILVPLANGTYHFSVGLVSGWTASPLSGSFPVDGAPVSVQIDWSPEPYAVNFTESGLPSGTVWSVAVNGGTPMTSNSSTLPFEEPVGNYSFRLGGVAGWTTTNYTGTFVVGAEGPNAVAVRWSEKIYSVTFSEVGLPPGDSWSTTLGGQLLTSSSTSLAFHEPNGTYAFSVGVPNGYTTAASVASVVVDGASVQVGITVSAPHHSVTSSSSGLSGEQIAALAAAAVLVPVVAFLWLRSKKTAPPSPPTPPV